MKVNEVTWQIQQENKKITYASYSTELTKKWSQSNWSGGPNRQSLILHVVILKVKSALGVWYILMCDSNWTRKGHTIRGLKLKGMSALFCNLYVNTELTLFTWSCLSGCYADHLLHRFTGWVFVSVFILKNMIRHTLCFTQHFSIHIQYEIPEMIDIINKNHE